MPNPDCRWVYFFGSGEADAGSELKSIVGGKGASLGDMTRAGLNVPPGFTISAECCDLYIKAANRWPDGLEAEMRQNLARLERLSSRVFGAGGNPLLVAVRSGAAHSMPGMMDTILNVGLNPECVREMGPRTGNIAGAWQAYLHFQLMFARTTTALAEADLDMLVADFVKAAGKSHEDHLDAAQMESLSGVIAEHYRQHTGRSFPIDPWVTLVAAVEAVFGSWMNERAITYRKHHKIDGLFGTAVNVQMMCAAEISGVMFTGNPVDPRSEQMIIESSYGLGEAIVLGKVTPDRFVVDKRSLTILERHIAHKDKRVATLADGRGHSGGAGDASLTDSQVVELARLGLRVEEYFKYPCDLEWALSQGAFFLLQARAIRYHAAAHIDPAERERLRQEEIERLTRIAETEGTVWARFNLSEILPAPTPMTWSIIRPFMSGTGGFGLMYRDLGFTPAVSLDDECPFDLIAGRVYCNLTREPKMQYGDLPFEHNFAKLKADPARAIYPTADFNPRKASLGFWMRFPWHSIKQWWGESKRQGALRTFASQFETKIAPAFLKDVEAAEREDWTKLDDAELLRNLIEWKRKTLNAFARESLKPTALAAILMAKIESAFARRYQPPGTKPKPGETSAAARARSALQDLTMGVRPPLEADFAQGIEKLEAGEMTREAFLKTYGHRGSDEMELAAPRWSESPAAVDDLARDHGHKPRANAPTFSDHWARITKELRLAPFQIPFVERQLRSLHQLLGLREAGKHFMLRGYALMRRALTILDERHGLDGDIFYLTFDELAGLIRLSDSHQEPAELLKRKAAERRRKRDLLLSLPLPQVIFSDALDVIGRELAITATETIAGTPLSAGQGEAVAWVLDHAAGATPPAESYILVCPTTDPSWVPLFGRAKGLVMETGGVLSHGAIVAREFGLPAVAGIPDVHRRLKTGQRLFVDGGAGVVKVLSTDVQR
jgi:phosphohistidine swiveling domain-containing protein